MTFPEFCAREARRSTMFGLAILAGILAVFAYLGHVRRQGAASAKEGAAR